MTFKTLKSLTATSWLFCELKTFGHECRILYLTIAKEDERRKVLEGIIKVYYPVGIWMKRTLRKNYEHLADEFILELPSWV